MMEDVNKLNWLSQSITSNRSDYGATLILLTLGSKVGDLVIRAIIYLTTQV